MPKPLLPVMKRKCATCPFREGSPYASLRTYLHNSAVTESTRICHSTGKSAINPRGTGKPPRVCRGARDEQLTLFHRLGVIAKPTDAAWQEAWDAIQAQKKGARRGSRV